MESRAPKLLNSMRNRVLLFALLTFSLSAPAPVFNLACIHGTVQAGLYQEILGITDTPLSAGAISEIEALGREIPNSTKGLVLAYLKRPKSVNVEQLSLKKRLNLDDCIAQFLDVAPRAIAQPTVLVEQLRGLRKQIVFTPTEITEAVKERILDEDRTYKEVSIDELVGLDDQALRDEDHARHGNEKHGDERTWMHSGHNFYSSSYGSFGVYDKYLNIPPGGKVCDLGAGPFKAAVWYHAMRPDVEVVGYELFQSRVDAGRRVVERMGAGDKARIFQKNLSEPKLNLETADAYILMNPFPGDTSMNIFKNLKEIAKKDKKKFRVLIFSSAYDTIAAAAKERWLTDLGHHREADSRYGFQLYEVDPAKL